MLQTPEFVRSQSALLFTWILALKAQFDHGQRQSPSSRGFMERDCPNMFIPVATNPWRLFKDIISLLSATPAEKLAQERS